MATIIGELEAKEIARLKSLNGDVFLITVKDDDENTHCAYVKKPDLNILGAAAKYADTDPVKSGILMYNSVKLSCSDKIENDDELKMSVIAKLGTLFKVREAEIKKL